MPRNLLLFITIRVDRSVTRYEREGGRHCMSISGDLELYIIGASGLDLGLQVKKDLGEVEILK